MGHQIFMYNLIGTPIEISGFAISGLRGDAGNNKSIAIIIKGGTKTSVRTGASADIESLISILKRCYSYIEVWSALNKKIDEVNEKISRPKSLKYLNKHDLILICYSGASGSLVNTISKNGLKHIAFRAQNPELPHRLNYFLLSKNPKYLIIALKGLFSDFKVVRNSRLVFTISDYDLKWYFAILKYLSSSKCILHNLSYFPKNTEHEKSELSFANDKDSILLIGSSTRSTLVSGADRKLIQMFHKEKLDGKLFSGVGYGLEPLKGLLKEDYGFVEDLNGLISKHRVIVIPTTSGWGFKTKIADLISFDKKVIVHEKLANKIDSEILNHLKVVKSWKELENLDKTFRIHKTKREFLEIKTLEHVLRSVERK